MVAIAIKTKPDHDPEPKRKVLILWSGGRDSTLMILHACRDPEIGAVRCLSLNHGNFFESQPQKIARRRLRTWFKRHGMEFKSTEVWIADDKSRQFSVTTGGTQQPIPLLAIAANYVQENEEVQVGFLSGADALQKTNDMVIFFQAACRLGGKTARVSFPLSNWDKPHVIHHLRRDRGILSRCHFCEEAKFGKTCGKCPSCKTHRTALWQLRTGMATWG